jgi:uncharacterized membrane protein YphA (DoxX/SURF4 family)
MRKHINGTKIALVWTVLRIWLGLQWIEAGFYKIKLDLKLVDFYKVQLRMQGEIILPFKVGMPDSSKDLRYPI